MWVIVLLLCDLGGLASLLTSPYDAIAIGVCPLIFGFGLALTAAGIPKEERAVVFRVFALAFLLRVAAAIVIYGLGFVGTLGDEDSSGWFAGWGISQAWRGDPQFFGAVPNFAESLHRGNQGYYYLAAGLLYLIGTPSRVSLALLSALAGAMTAVLVYRIGVLIAGRAAAERAGMLAAIFPSLVAWAGQTVKEPFVVLCECAIVYAVLVLRSRFSVKTLALFAVSVFALYTMRFYAAYLSLVSALLVFLWPQGSRRGQTPLVGALVLSLVVVGLFASGLWHTEAARLSEFNLGWVQSFRTDTATGWGSRTGIVLPFDASSPLGVFASLPLSLVAFLLSPFPWQVVGGSARLKFAMVDVALWWWLIPNVVAGVREVWRTQRAAAGYLMLFVWPLTLFYALTFGNAGLAFRERGQILVLLLVFAGVGLSRPRTADAPLPARAGLSGSSA